MEIILYSREVIKCRKIEFSMDLQKVIIDDGERIVAITDIFKIIF